MLAFLLHYRLLDVCQYGALLSLKQLASQLLSDCQGWIGERLSLAELGSSLNFYCCGNDE